MAKSRRPGIDSRQQPLSFVPFSIAMSMDGNGSDCVYD